MIRSIFTSVSFVVILNALVKPLWLLTENVVHDKVGHEEWGMYTALFSFAFLFISFSDLGINQYATKHLAEKPELFKEYYPNFLSIKLLLNLIYPLLMWGIGWLWGFSGRTLQLLVLISSIHGLSQFIHFFRSQFQAKQRFNLDAVISVADKAMLLIVVSILLQTYIDLELFIISRLIILAALSVSFFVLINYLYGWNKPRWNGPLIKKMLWSSASFAMINILYSIHDKVDQVMLQRINGDVETSLYAGAYRWLDATSMYLWIILPIFFSKFAFHMNDVQIKNKLLRIGQLITAVPLIFVAVFVFFYGEKLLFLFTHSTAEQLMTMQHTLKILFISLVVNGLVIIYSTLLTATGHENFVNKMIFVGILVNVSMNLWLMPVYGAIGAAWATVCSLSLMGISYLWYTNAYLKEQLAVDYLVKLIGSMGCLVGVFWGLSQLSLPWYVVSVLAGIIYVGLCWVLRLVPTEILDYLGKK